MQKIRIEQISPVRSAADVVWPYGHLIATAESNRSGQGPRLVAGKFATTSRIRNAAT